MQFHKEVGSSRTIHKTVLLDAKRVKSCWTSDQALLYRTFSHYVQHRYQTMRYHFVWEIPFVRQTLPLFEKSCMPALESRCNTTTSL